jgi:hypothetical protein
MPGTPVPTRSRLLAVAAFSMLAGLVLRPSPVLSHNPTTTTVLFNREVSSIFRQKCAACHGEALMAMPLDTYAQARPWAVAIKEEVLARRMPPWPAERGYGDFANDTSLTTREFDFLLSWVEGGAPSGDGDPPLAIDHGGHWMLGEPDTIATPGTGVRVPSGRPPAVERLVVDPKITREQWLRAMDFKPSDRRVVRAAFFTVEGSGEYLGGWTPSSQTAALPDDVAIRLPARARIAVDVLYSGASQDVVDQPRLGLSFRKARPARPISNLVLRQTAGTSSTPGAMRLRAMTTLPAARTVLALRPELPPSTRSLEVKATRPDGSSEVLLWIREYKPDWPTPYVFRRPVELPLGSVVTATARLKDGFAAGRGAAASLAVTLTTIEGGAAATGTPAVHQH